jgi:hypothetical protein
MGWLIDGTAPLVAALEPDPGDLADSKIEAARTRELVLSESGRSARDPRIAAEVAGSLCAAGPSARVKKLSIERLRVVATVELPPEIPSTEGRAFFDAVLERLSRIVRRAESADVLDERPVARALQEPPREW